MAKEKAVMARRPATPDDISNTLAFFDAASRLESVRARHRGQYLAERAAELERRIDRDPFYDLK